MGDAKENDPETRSVAMKKRRCNLDEMLDRITPDNLHSEQDTGEARGNERR